MADSKENYREIMEVKGSKKGRCSLLHQNKSDTFDAAHKVFKGVLILGVYRAPLDNSLVTKWVTLF